MRYNVSVSNVISVTLPWVPEVFLACSGYFLVLTEGRHVFGRRPKPRAAKPREKRFARVTIKT